MAINYTNVFTSIGKFVKNLNYYYGTTLPAIAAAELEIGDVLNSNDEYDILDGFDTLHASLQDNVTSWINQYGQRISKELTSQPRVTQWLAIPVSSSVQDTLLALIRDMIANSQTVKNNSIGLGTPTANAANVGDAVMLKTAILDGVTSPDQANSAPFSLYYKGLTSELVCTSETMTLTATTDSGSGATEGAESFSVVGGQKSRQPYDWKTLNADGDDIEGSGTGPNIKTLNGYGFIQNGEFETWTVTNIPDNWSILTGVVTTNFLREASSVKRGTYALAIKGDGSTANLEITQDMSNRGLVANKSYLVAVWVKGQASTAAGTLVISFTGTGYSAGTNEKISMNAAALSAATSYGVQYFQVNMPTIIPFDFKLSLKITGTLTNAKNVFLDGLCVGDTIYHGGVGMGVIAGGTPVRKNDRYTLAVTNASDAKFQTMLRKFFHVQLPSVSSSETIDDTLAS